MVKFFGKNKATAELDLPEEEGVVLERPDVSPGVAQKIGDLLADVQDEAKEGKLSDSEEAVEVLDQERQAWQVKDIPDQPA